MTDPSDTVANTAPTIDASEVVVSIARLEGLEVERWKMIQELEKIDTLLKREPNTERLKWVEYCAKDLSDQDTVIKQHDDLLEKNKKSEAALAQAREALQVMLKTADMPFVSPITDPEIMGEVKSAYDKLKEALAASAVPLAGDEWMQVAKQLMEWATNNNFDHRHMPNKCLFCGEYYLRDGHAVDCLHIKAKALLETPHP